MSNVQFIEPSYRFSDTDASHMPAIYSGYPIKNRPMLSTMARITRTEFGSRLVQARKRAKLTQDQLCAQIGIAQSTLSEAETLAIGSKHTPQLAEALGVNALWLASGQGPVERQAASDLFTPSAVQPDESSPSVLAKELSLLFDGLSDRVDRARAYNAATQAILHVMQQRDAISTAAPPEAVPASPKTRQQ